MNIIKKYTLAATGMVFLICCTADGGGELLPGTFLVKAETLAANKRKIKSGDRPLAEALEEIKADAAKALVHGPYSVTYKSKTPPSGDKHDYMSVGPYWWPDPSKPDGLPYIRKDGEVNPERYAVKDAEYFKDLCRDVSLLSAAWFYTDEERYAAKAVELLRIWFLDEETRMNPNLNYGQAIPGHTDGRGIGLIDTRGFAELADGIQLLKNSGALTDGMYRQLQEWFARYLEWITTSPIGLDEADEHNNHGTYYDVQTVSLSLFTGQRERAARILQTQTCPRIESQLAEDGSQPHELARTLSCSYSQMNLAGFFALAALAENTDVDLWNYVSPGGKSIRAAFFWLLPYAEGKAEWTHQQIKPADFTEFAELSHIAAAKYPGEAVSAYAAGRRTKNALFILTH
ncbi:MAG: alginate lyase family protein [Tannerella sp.]|jgi:hypothetical protein|nr:alginate lyase family protein [Tannerella sp.]